MRNGIDINDQTCTRTLYMHTTLYLYLCVQFLHTAAHLLPVSILSHIEVLALQFYHT